MKPRRILATLTFLVAFQLVACVSDNRVESEPDAGRIDASSKPDSEADPDASVLVPQPADVEGL